MTAPPTIHLKARLVPDVDTAAADLPRSWFVSHGIGTPAANTYTEVAFADDFEDEDGAPWPEHVIERAVRQVTAELYGSCWAFIYRPDQAAHAIYRHGLRRRERVLITELEVWA